MDSICGFFARCAAGAPPFAAKKKGCTPTRDAASRVVAPSFLRNPQRRLCRHAFWDSARRMSLKTMHFAWLPSASALPTRKKRPHPGAGCGLPGCSPLLPPQSAAAALPARFPGFGAPNVSQNHAPCTVPKRVGFAKRKKGRTPARDAASRVVAPSFLCNPQRRLCRHAVWDSARRMSLKTMRLARFPSASALPTRKKRPHPDAGCGLPGCSPLLPPQSAATACALRESGPPARFPGFGAPNVSQNHAPCTVSKRVGFAKRKKRPHPDAGCGLRFVS